MSLMTATYYYRCDYFHCVDFLEIESDTPPDEDVFQIHEWEQVDECTHYCPIHKEIVARQQAKEAADEDKMERLRSERDCA
ncbi:MAG: hypothetical protein MJA83_10260 [Gammaproteobacteria bacterium]|nr:hypothetical protein [Gammaproteobacteria bacterium]